MKKDYFIKNMMECLNLGLNKQNQIEDLPCMQPAIEKWLNKINNAIEENRDFIEIEKACSFDGYTGRFYF